MALKPLAAQPGVNLTESDYAGGKAGRFTIANNVEFSAGYAQKIAGYISAIGAGTLDGTVRNMKSWRDVNGKPRLMIATEKRLYDWDGTTLKNATPYIPLMISDSGMISIATTIGSTSVVITDPTFGSYVRTDDYVYISWVQPTLGVPTPVGGLLFPGAYYHVTAVGGGGAFTITVPTAASSTQTYAAGFAAQDAWVAYPRAPLNAGTAFTTTNGSNVVVVNHGFGLGGTAAAFFGHVGTFVRLTSSVTINGVLLAAGEHLTTFVSTNAFSIIGVGNASSSGTGGDNLVSFPPSMAQQAFGTTLLFPKSWSLAPYGGLMAANPCGGTVYLYDPLAGTDARAYPLVGAPLHCASMFVTPERIIVAVGASTMYSGTNTLGSPLLIVPNTILSVELGYVTPSFTGSLLCVAWSDQTDPTQWLSLTANTAQTGRTLQGGDYLVGGIAARDGTSLLFSNRCTFAMTYNGNYLVYDTPMIADQAGLISPNAVCSTGGTVYWMGDQELWTWSGSVQAMPSDDVRQFLFANLNRTTGYNVFAGVNRAKKQIRFWYPSGAATDNSDGLIFHYDSRVWSTTDINRNAWVDSGLFPHPYGADGTQALLQEETGVDALAGVALASRLTLSPIDISNGDANMDIFGIIPDFERQTGDMTLTVLVKIYPEDTAVVVAPVTLKADGSTPRIDLRDDGKLVGFQLDSNVVGGDFRLGVPRVDVKPSGSRN